MSLFEEAQRYLPRHLTEDDTKKLFEDIKAFPGNLDKRLYMTPVKEDEHALLQGDGIGNMLVVNLPQPEIRPTPVMLFSNSCDSDIANERAFPTALCYAPIFSLEKYLASLRKRKDEKYVQDHESAIRRQQLTQIFFLPRSGKLEGDSIVFLDRINNCASKSFDRERLPNDRLFSLSTFGHWLFLLKLSIHFSRLTDKTERGGAAEPAKRSEEVGPPTLH
ncbi:hypothetical protein [Paraburkholderia tropica]|uniref:hypothetical protein n=1 Tax=Paraburkholderia tropica TaxID=92647 RepID=UPI002AB6C8C7|nr:hypothetical protein [Paraburkholderia tropica]